MQDKFCSSLQFLQRTDNLTARLNCYLRDLPAKIGISERSMFGYRAGKYPVTAKALRKLEQAERDAGIVPVAMPGEVGIAESSANLKELPSVPGENLPPQPDPFSLQSQIDAIRLYHAPFTLAELQARMSTAKAWPPTVADGKLTPAQLWNKYSP